MPVSRFPRLTLPPGPPVRRRSPELTYASAEHPPAATALTLGLQHALTALTLITYVIAAATLGRLDVAQTQALVAATALAMGVGTAFQSWGGRVGPGILLVHIPNPLFLLLMAEVIGRYGSGGLVMASLLAAVSMLLVSVLLPFLRTLFPPAVAGVVICMSGLSLGGSSLAHAVGLDAQGLVDGPSLLIALVTLGMIVGCSVWGSRQVKLLGMLAGIAAGLLAALLAGRLTGAEQIAQAPLFALPSLPTPVFAIDPGLAAAIMLVAIMSQLDTLGSVVLMQKVEDADWRRADMKTAGKAMRANGLGDLVGACLGAYSTVTSSANIALAHISRSTSRIIGLVAAALLVLVAVMPQLTLALTLLPAPIIGAIEIYVAAFLIVGGIELITQRALDSRGIFVVGISLTLGLGVELIPALAQNVPAALTFIAGNGLIVASLTAIGLNLLFRLGTSRSATITLADAPDGAPAITDFVTQQGAAWGARRDVITRAALAALEASEALQASPGRRLLALRGSFDEYNLDVELLHDGPPLPLGAPVAADLRHLLDDEDDASLSHALAGASTALLHHLADRLQSGHSAGQSFLRLHFDH
ncbi:purine/pyrimidine permease [Achromobacter sp. GG226]|uniref:solute carrier family 23 protein n=1 Tax=Verticiella alkaliphila TaxID=2779529 RepID=UPI001C0B237E|nr:solute carrier family 23 protein [Verticiella sp. GG226]MBU4610685.1 purine/pyrimidine permease [Verticiella sp. GG226]